MGCPLQRRSSDSGGTVPSVVARQQLGNSVVTAMNTTEWDRLRRVLAFQLPYKGPLFVRYAFRDATFSSSGAKAGLWFANATVLNTAEQLDLQLFDSIRDGPPAFTISRADLVSFAGAVTISNYGGNEIMWRPGRVDATSGADAGVAFHAPISASEDPNNLRGFFKNYPGFDDKDIVALMGAHNMGFCHFNKSGFNGPWSLNPYYLTNEYFQRLTKQIQSNGRVYKPVSNVSVTIPFRDNTRYVDTSGQSNGLIMLPADIALTLDSSFKQFVQSFAQNQDQFQLHFQSAFQELLEYGLNLTAPYVSTMLGVSQSTTADSVQLVANSNCYPPSGPPIVCVTRRDDTNGNAIFTVFSALKGWVGIGVGSSTMTNGDVIVGYNTASNSVETLAFKTVDHNSPVLLNTNSVWTSLPLDTSVTAPSWVKISFTASHPITASANGNPVNGFMTFAASDFLSPNTSIRIVAHDVSGVLSRGQNDVGPFPQTDTSSSSGSSALSSGAIAGIAVGAAVIGIAVALLIVFWKRIIGNSKRQPRRTMESEMSHNFPIVPAPTLRTSSDFNRTSTLPPAFKGDAAPPINVTGGRVSFLATNVPRETILTVGTTTVVATSTNPGSPTSVVALGSEVGLKVDKSSALFQGLGFWDLVEGYMKGNPAFPQDPATWDGAAAAAWVWKNGGNRESAEVVLQQDVTGDTLAGKMISADELLGLFAIVTVGNRVKFVTALQQLREVGSLEVPPAYVEQNLEKAKDI